MTPAGATCRIFVDLRDQIAIGDVIQTPTGRSYGVLEVRRQRSASKHPNRQHLRVLVLDEASLAEARDGKARLFTIRWYKRSKRSTMEQRA